MSNVISFNVYKNTLRRSSGNDPVSSESGYTEILCRFKEGDDWEGVNGGIVTAGFFVSEDNVEQMTAYVANREARFTIPGTLVGNRNPIFFGIAGSISTGENSYITIATNVVKLDVIRGVVIDRLSPDAEADENHYAQLLETLNEGLTNKAAIDHTHPEYVSEDELHVVIDNIEDVLDSIAIPQQYGAMGDGETDDTAAIQAAIDDADAVLIPAGNYLIDCQNVVGGTENNANPTYYGISVPSNKTIILDENAVLIKNGSTAVFERMIDILPQATKIKISGGRIVGDRVYKMTESTAEQVKLFAGNSYGIRLNGNSGVTLEGIKITDCAGDGISVADSNGNASNDIVIKGCVIDRCWRNGVNLAESKGVDIVDCVIQNSGCCLDDNGENVVIKDFAENYSDKITDANILNNQTEAKIIANLIDRMIVDGNYTKTGSGNNLVVTGITNCTGTLKGRMPMTGIDIEPDTNHLTNTGIRIKDCLFTENSSMDIKLIGRNGDILIEGCQIEKGLQSARPAFAALPSEDAADYAEKVAEREAEQNVVIRNCYVGVAILHGERLEDSTVGKVNLANGSGQSDVRADKSFVDGCLINQVEISSQQSADVNYFNNCTIKSHLASGNQSTYKYDHCKFCFGKDADSRFGGTVYMRDCVVEFDTTYIPENRPGQSVINFTNFYATNTEFKAPLYAGTINGFIEGTSNSGTKDFEYCTFDVAKNYTEVFRTYSGLNLVNATIKNCTFYHHDSPSNPSRIDNNSCTIQDNEYRVLSRFYTKNEIDNKGYLIQHQDISGKEDKNNKVTSMSSSSTDTQYPTAKAVYDKIRNQMLTLTEVRASYAGNSGETPRYKPGKWFVETGASPVEGNIYTIKIPGTGTTSGQYMSVHGTDDADYCPIVVGGTGRLTTQFAAGVVITVIYETNQSVTVYELNSTTTNNSTYSYTGNVFRVLNFYDSGNTNTLLRTYALSSNKEFPLIGASTATSGTPAAHTSSYKDIYGMIPSAAANKATINLSTGKITVPGGIEGNLTGTASAAPWSGITGKPTTLSGYGITDAYNKTEVNNLLSGKADTSHTHSQYLTLATLPIYNGGVQ